MDHLATAHIIILTDKEERYQQLKDLLPAEEFSFECELCNDIADAFAKHPVKHYELLISWMDEKCFDQKQISEYLQGVDKPPGLILITQDPKPQDFILGSKVGAGDIINSNIPIQFAFAFRRELINIRRKRKLDAMIDKLEEVTIVDQVELHKTTELKAISSVVGVIDDALKNDGFELLFQPIMAVEDDQHDNYEVFLRIKAHDGHIVPEEFLPSAEQYGLMPAIDRWVVKNAIYRFKVEEEVKRVRKQDARKLRFFLNISGHSLVDEVMMGNIITEIIKAKLEPGSIVIEVDKNTVLSRLQKVKSLNTNIKKLNLEFAIDHYEASDNALNYLSHIQLDYIKLNQDILDNVHSDTGKKDAIKEIIDKARQDNIKVVASQIDNANILPILYELGIDYIQGFAISAPNTRLGGAVMDATI